MFRKCVYIIAFAGVVMCAANDVFAQKKQSQEMLGNAYLECQYAYSYAQDTLHLDTRKEDRMLLLIGKAASKFYSYTTAMADSAQKADFAKNLSHDQILANRSKYSGGVSELIYKNNESLFTIDKLVKDYFRVDEPLPDFGWVVADDDTINILGYPSRKATCRFRGRSYIAWFTTAIAISNGPWKFSGLPGLIMKIQDTANHYNWEIVGIKNVTDSAIALENRQYIQTTREKFSKMTKRFKEDPFAYMESVGIKVTVTGPSGKPMSSSELKKTKVTVALGDSVTSIGDLKGGYDPIER
ncbi:MAG: GLPGLI family protein [Bacteroidales bacterium]